MPAWNRDSDRALDAELRAARPEPRAEVTQAIAERVRPRETAGKRRLGRLHLALAGGLTALVLAPVVAAGFGGVGSFGKTKSTKAGMKSGAAFLSKAPSGRALGAVSGNRNRALARLSRAGGTRFATAMPSGGGASLWSADSASGFLGGVLQPQNDFAATQVQYDQVCELDGAIIQENDATITQGGNTATGGNATATGGDGGDANTGNVQTNTGTGDTTATSGNATGGDGGDATAIGGDAIATNIAGQTLVNVVCVDGD